MVIVQRIAKCTVEAKNLETHGKKVIDDDLSPANMGLLLPTQ